MKQLAQGKQDFKKLIEQNLIYVDKTEEIHKLISSSAEYIFFSRPRRFGKSLLISTLKYLFLGEKELFKGLFIYDKHDFESHPVIHIDFSDGVANRSPDLLRNSLKNSLHEKANVLGVELKGSSLEELFAVLIKNSFHKSGKRVVILIDEYDKAITDNLTNIPVAEENRKVLRELFSGMKNADQYLRLLFITGVSRFAKVSIFSTLNNVTDISLMPEFHNLVGFKPKDIPNYFQDYLQLMQEKYGMSRVELMQEIQRMYNGYSWDGEQKLYNPYSLTAAFFQKKLENFWFQSGTPSFLIELIRKRNIFIPDLENQQHLLVMDGTDDLGHLDLVALLFQTGYLTVGNVEQPYEIGENTLYELKYPNKEVKNSMLRHLLADKVGLFAEEVAPKYMQMKKALRSKDIKTFSKLLKATFAKIPAKLHLKAEAYYHSLFYLLLYLLGSELRLEEEQSMGTVDAVLETDNYVYIIEFKYAQEGKMESLLQKAMNQIKLKKYYAPYLAEKREVLLLAVGFLGKGEIGLEMSEGVSEF